MISIISERLNCPVIRVFGNHICGVIILSSIFDRDFENDGGPILGIEVSLEDCKELRLNTKDLNSEGMPSPKGILHAKGTSISACGIDCALDLSDRGVQTGMLFSRNCHNGSMNFMGTLSNSLILQNSIQIIPEVIEGVYLDVEGAMDNFLFCRDGNLIGIAIVDQEIPLDNFKRVEQNLNEHERANEWILEYNYKYFNLPYNMAREAIFKKYFEISTN